LSGALEYVLLLLLLLLLLLQHSYYDTDFVYSWYFKGPTVKCKERQEIGLEAVKWISICEDTATNIRVPGSFSIKNKEDSAEGNYIR